MAWKNVALLKTTPRYEHGATVSTAVAAYADANGINSMSSYEVGWGTARPGESFLAYTGRYVVSRLAVNEQFKFAQDDTHYVRVQRIADSSPGVIAQLRVFIANGGAETNVKTWSWRYSDQGHFDAIGFLVNSATSEIDLFLCNNYWPINQPEREKGLNQSLLNEQPLMRGVLYNMFNGLVPVPDPYAGGGSSTTGGGGGNYDDTSDTISLPSAPALNLSLNHFISAYVPTITELNNLADYIWGNYDKTDSTKVLSKILANPQDAIVGLFMLPFTPGSSTAIEVTIGNYGTSVSMTPLTAQFVDVDCGTLTISEYWGNYLDYNPYTRLTLFLPGVGEVQLDPDEVMGVTISVLYRVDCLTGNFICFVSGDNKIFAQYQGNCALQVPVSSADYSRLNQAMLQAALGAVGAVAGVATAGGAVAAAMEGAEAAAGGASTALNIMNSKVNHSHSGTLSGSGFFMGSQKPYVIIHRARQSVPEDANEFYGYPSNVTGVLGSQYGFTSVKSIRLDGVPFSDQELEELRGILKGGVYL